MSLPPMGNGIDERRTPRELFNRLYKEHAGFTLDAAASHQNAQLSRYCTLEGTFTGNHKVSNEDGLSFSWADERVFINPPYGRGLLAPFIEKAYVEATEHGVHVVALLPVRTEQPWFHEFVYDRSRSRWRPGVRGVEFIRGRVKYDGLTTGAPFPSMVVTWG